jgi:hypothetical protein
MCRWLMLAPLLALALADARRSKPRRNACSSRATKRSFIRMSC